MTTDSADSRPGPVLVLGGTADARAVAAGAVAAGARVVYALAGRTVDAGASAPPGCALRLGGFGGAAGLARWLTEAGARAVIDATHPFAAGIAANAATACARTGVPRLKLVRPPWQADPAAGDRWIEVPDLAAAPAAIPDGCARVWLTVGAGGLAPFAQRSALWYLVRSVTPIALPPGLPHGRTIIGRGPFDLDAERTLIDSHRIDCLVTKNSGGTATAAKLEAARATGLPVVMVARPPPPAGPVAATTDAALTWLAAAGTREGAGRTPVAADWPRWIRGFP